MNPETGGVQRLPAPHPMKKMEDAFPVTSSLPATQEKQEPNCHDTKNPVKGNKIRKTFVVAC